MVTQILYFFIVLLTGSTSTFVAGHHIAGTDRGFGGFDVVLPPRQSLDLSSRGTTSPAPDGPTVKPTWCFTPVKALNLRRGAPRRPARPALFHARRTIGPAWHHVARPFRKHQKRAAVDFSKRQLPAIHIFNTSSSDYTNIVTNGMVNRDSRVVSA